MSLRDELREYITNISLKKQVPTDFSDDYDLIEREVLDSLAYLGLITYVENNYQIELVEEDITPENFSSITMLARFVERKLA